MQSLGGDDSCFATSQDEQDPFPRLAVPSDYFFVMEIMDDTLVTDDIHAISGFHDSLLLKMSTNVP